LWRERGIVRMSTTIDTCAARRRSTSSSSVREEWPIV